MRQQSTEIPPISVATARVPPEPSAPISPQQPVMYRQQESSLTLAPMPTSAYWARRHITDVLIGWGLAEMEWPVCQVASELVVNAVAAVTGDDKVQLHIVRVTLRLLPRRLRLEVYDGSPRLPEARETADDDESGRGLHIVAALADSLDITSCRRGGKTVAVSFNLPGPPPATRARTPKG